MQMRNHNKAVHIPARGMEAIDGFNVKHFEELDLIGIGLTKAKVMQMKAMNDAMFAMDAIDPTVTTASIPTLTQFLQTWLQGFVRIATTPRKIDELIGITMQGRWFDVSVIQKIMELTGTARPYGDYAQIGRSSWNETQEDRNIVRFTEGMQVFALEEARAAAGQVDDSAMKREAAQEALEIQRNAIGFNGYAAGVNKTYGFLNDPGLPAYVTVAAGGGGTTWATKTFLEITKDIRGMVASLRTGSRDRIDPKSVPLTLALATAVIEYLSVTADFGNSVQKWINETYPNLRIVSAPELDGANGGENVAYLYAETVIDASSDNRRTFDQIVQSKFQVLGVARHVNSYEEGYVNATAGVMVKRPYAIVRRTGL